MPGTRTRSSPECERVRVSAYVPPDLAEALDHLAEARDLSVSAVASELIRDGLSTREPASPAVPS
jgi:predicted transcriptional regulator